MGLALVGVRGDGEDGRAGVRGKTKAEVKDKFDELRAEIKAGIRTPATYTVRQCVADWLESLTLDPDTVAEYRGQAEKWIYPKIGATRLRDFKAADADRFFKGLGKVLGKRSLLMIKSTLRRSIRRAQVQDLIGKNVVELVDLPAGQAGRPSRAMTEEQAGKVLKVAVGRNPSFVKVVRLKGRYGATHAARENGELACGNRPRTDVPVTEIGLELKEVTCRACRSQLGIDDNTGAAIRLEALFVLSITLGLRPGELRKLTWDLVDLDAGVIHVWRSASRTGDVKRRNPGVP